MDATTPLAQLGQQLHDFLVTTCTPPTAGGRNGIAFLPASTGVDPESFYINGVANPMLVQEWLSIIADPIVQVVDQAVSTQVFHASLLMQLVATAAQALTDPDTPQAQFIGLLKNQASAARLPDSDVVDSAPLDWYSPDRVSGWAHWSSSVSSGTPSGSGNTPPTTVEPGPPGRTGIVEGIWRWRQLEPIAVNPPVVIDPGPNPPIEVPPVRIPPITRLPGLTRHLEQLSITDPQTASARIALNRLSLAGLIAPTAQSDVVQDAPLRTETVGNDNVRNEAVQTDAAVQTNAALTAAAMSNGVQAEPTRSRVLQIDPTWLQRQTISATAADTSPVEASSLQLSLSYQLVQLSRTDWWSDSLIENPNWCFPGERAGAVLPGSLPPDAVIGLPIGLVLTDNVQVSGSWSDSDRKAIASSTNLGPWALQSTRIDASGMVSIPGMQLIAILYQQLSTIPPADDPSLPTVAPDSPPSDGGSTDIGTPSAGSAHAGTSAAPTYAGSSDTGTPSAAPTTSGTTSTQPIVVPDPAPQPTDAGAASDASTVKEI